MPVQIRRKDYVTKLKEKHAEIPAGLAARIPQLTGRLPQAL